MKPFTISSVSARNLPNANGPYNAKPVWEGIPFLLWTRDQLVPFAHLTSTISVDYSLQLLVSQIKMKYTLGLVLVMAGLVSAQFQFFEQFFQQGGQQGQGQQEKQNVRSDASWFRQNWEAGL